MKILLDSNIILRITDVRTPLPPEYAEMIRLAGAQHHDLCYHPWSCRDIQSDHNEDRREINLSRIEQYQCLENPPLPDEIVVRGFNWTAGDRNNDVDNALLYAVVRGATEVLVTEDHKMHGKARRAGIADDVFTVGKLLEKLRSSEKKKGSPPSEFLKIENLRMQDVDILDPIFDSLRIAYTEFNIWYRKVAAEGRCAWVVRGPRRNVIAVCIYKEEYNPEIGDQHIGLNGKVLKLCTFKVSGRGEKLGERLLDYAFHYAADNQYDFVYMQIRRGGDKALIKLVEELGFKPMSPYKQDCSYVKPMAPSGPMVSSANPNENLRFAIERFPYFLVGKNIRKFLVPIRPTFHDLLFPETCLQDMLFAQDGQAFPSETNAICKAYVCRSRITTIRAGDILLFYRSRQGRFVECVGVVETASHSNDIDSVLKIIARRTVFSDAQIRKIAGGKQVLVVRFRLVCYLEHPVKYDELVLCGVKGRYQSIRRISDDVYNRLFSPRLTYAVGDNCILNCTD